MSPQLSIDNEVASQPSPFPLTNGLDITTLISKSNITNSEGTTSKDVVSSLVLVSEEPSTGQPNAPKSVATAKSTDLFASFFADVTNNDESLSTAVRMATNSQNQWGDAKKLFNQERDDEKLDLRAKQAVLHLAWTDQRMKEMEREIKLLRSDLDGLPPDFESKKKLRFPVYKHAIKRSPLSEFRLNDESKNIPNDQRPVLEVLLEENMVSILPEATNMAEIETTGVSCLHRSPTKTASPIPEKLRIRSRPLLYLLSRICGQELLSVGHTRSTETPAPVIFLRPFKLFVAHEKEIRAAVGELELKIEKEANSTEEVQQVPGVKKEIPDFDNNGLLQDLNLLIEFLDNDLRSTFELREKIKDGSLKHIEYQDLWHLFNPDDIIVDSSDELQVYKVLSFTGGREVLIDKIHPGEKPTPLEGFMLDCYNLNFNGSFYGPKLYTHPIRRFRGSQAITSLPVYPLKFDPSAEELKQKLLAQGKQFLDLTEVPYAHKMLLGKTLDEPVEEIDAQVIVDMTLAINKNIEWNPNLKINETELTKADNRETHAPLFCHHSQKNNEGCCGSDVAHKDIQWDESRFSMYYRDHRQALGKRKALELSDEDRMLLPAWAYGFVLRSRRWITLRIADLSEVKYESTFDELVLPERHKNTVKALVQEHAKSSQDTAATSKVGAAMDLVRGKGKGLIILLHGEPGVGKTSTAECVADLTQRPLFPVTCGDIGETASEVQTNLDYNFQLAHKWGCVLLLDEADVFLARRSKSDLRRNAVVSVFLRTLEYYSGILFLTTNRVGSIDPAFKSRIHMSLFYPQLSREATEKLYKVFIKRTTTEQENSHMADFKVKPKEIMKFAKSHFKRLKENGMATWNGRQIRNAFQTAIALAEYDARQPGAESIVLGKKQFEIIAQSSEEFDKYLKNTIGMTESDLARREHLRSDHYGQTVEKSSGSSRVALGPRKRSARDPESDWHISSSSESEESNDDDEDDDSDSDSNDNEDDDDDDDKKELIQEPVMRPSKGSKVVKTKSVVDEDQMEAFQRYLIQEKRGKSRKK